MTATKNWTPVLRTLASKVSTGFFQVTHNGFALLGLAVMFVVIALIAQPELRRAGELQLMDWLQERQFASTELQAEPEAIERSTALNPQELPSQQAAVAYWLGKKYRVAPEPLGALVQEAYDVGQRIRIDPMLILAVMAVESGFNPFAQSPRGAQGLMQVMTRVHTDKYESFGGQLAAFDPLTNLRVGAKVLKDCIARAGSLEGGLRLYVGSTKPDDDNGYGAKVLAEHDRLKQVAAGLRVPTTAPNPSPGPIPVAAPVVPGPTAPPEKLALNS